MLARMLGVARLNVATFEDVEHDSGATLQAMLIVIVVFIATGVGCGPHLAENGTRSQRPGPSRETGRIVKVERSRRGIRVLAGQRTLNSPLQGMLRTSP